MRIPLPQSLDRFPIPATKVRDLEVFDGPLVSEFRSPHGDTYLSVWCDADDQASRWMFVRVDRRSVLDYLGKRLSLRDVITKPEDGFVYFVDIATDGTVAQVSLRTTDNLPAEYLPTAASFHDENLMPAAQASNVADVLMDGVWDVCRFAEFPKKLEQAFTFLYYVRGNRPKPPSDRMFSDYRWKGGYVASTFYRELASMIPSEDRPVVRSIRYASPGVMTFTGEADTLGSLRRCVADFPGHQGASRIEYRFVQDWSHARVPAESTQKVASIKQLASLLGVDGPLLLSLSNDPDIAGKILSTFYRRIRTLADYDAQQLARFT